MMSRYARKLLRPCQSTFVPGRYLDIGCGTFDFLQSARLPDACDYVGLDPHRQTTRNLGQWESFVQGTAVELPFRTRAFDLVLCKDVLHHVHEEDRTAVLREALRVAKRRLLVVESERRSPVSYVQMVLINRHKHFSFSIFREIILKIAPKGSVTFLATSAHYGFPFLKNSTGHALLALLEALEDRVGLENYNIAIIDARVKDTNSST